MQMLNWLNRFNICAFLDNHLYQTPAHEVECLAAAGCLSSITSSAGTALLKLDEFHKTHSDWIFGHLAYDLKNEIEQLQSANPDYLYFPDLFFFQPDIVISMSEKFISIGVHNDLHDSIFLEINTCPSWISPAKNPQINITSRFTKESYIDSVNRIRNHILVGDCYEVNFCQEFFANEAVIDPIAVYHALATISPNPFAAFYRINELYVLCGSPERYLQKKKNRLMSQPIKGTLARQHKNEGSDIAERKLLIESAKDKAENVMVVDLVRNDLARVSEKGSVKVSELFGVYTFPQVHQMISTITGIVQADKGLKDILSATFPMGSMTGAPKKRVMEIIEQYEKTKRSIFSGAMGYITPSGDFDFNVVIRSIFYNASKKYLSFQAGSAITFNSNSDEEYEESLLKAEVIKKVLANANTS
ncbi:MAG TPA: anthranilate synthase component I family protein [Flavitalea sp.]|nr:anthranilate synthase component I family protein [Flavitalea sp.]